MIQKDSEFLLNLARKYDLKIKYTENELKNFYCIEEDGIYTACFNEGGQCYMENFKTYTGVLLYLNTDLDLDLIFYIDEQLQNIK